MMFRKYCPACRFPREYRYRQDIQSLTDRNRHGGDIIMLIQNLLVPKVVAAEPDNLELLIISVTNQVNTCKHHIGLFYRPPSSGAQCI